MQYSPPGARTSRGKRSGCGKGDESRVCPDAPGGGTQNDATHEEGMQVANGEDGVEDQEKDGGEAERGKNDLRESGSETIWR